TNDPGLCSALITADILSYPVVYDACGFFVTATGIPSGYMFPVGITTVTWTAIDTAGNSTSSTQTVTVTDEESPTITCSGNITVNTDVGQCNAYVTIPPTTASDNCSISSITNDF